MVERKASGLYFSDCQAPAVDRLERRRLEEDDVEDGGISEEKDTDRDLEVGTGVVDDGTGDDDVEEEDEDDAGTGVGAEDGSSRDEDSSVDKDVGGLAVDDDSDDAYDFLIASDRIPLRCLSSNSSGESQSRDKEGASSVESKGIRNVCESRSISFQNEGTGSDGETEDTVEKESSKTT